MTESGWISIVTLIMSGIGTMFAAYIGMKQREINQRVALVADKTEAVAVTVGEAKDKIDQTKEKVNQNLEKLDGRLTLLLDETKRRAHAEGKAEALLEAQEIAKTLVAAEAVARAQLIKAKAEADAIVLKTEQDRTAKSEEKKD